MKIEVGKRYVTSDMHIFDIVAKTDISKSPFGETIVFIGIYQGQKPAFSMLFHENGSPFTADSNYTLINRAYEFNPEAQNLVVTTPQPGEVWETRNGSKVLLTLLNLYATPPWVLRGIIIEPAGGYGYCGETLYFFEDGGWGENRKEDRRDLVKKCKDQSYDKSNIILPGNVKGKSA